MTVRLYIIAGRPNRELAVEAVAASERITASPELQSITGNTALTLSNSPGGPWPHVTLVQIAADEAQVGALGRRLEKVAARHVGPITLDPIGFGGGGRYANVQYKNHDKLSALRKDVLRQVSELDIDLAPEQAVALEQLRTKRQRGWLSAAEAIVLATMEKYGNKDTHLTVTRFDGKDPLSTEQRDLVVATMSPVDQYDGYLETVAIYSMGDNGTCIGEPVFEASLARRVAYLSGPVGEAGAGGQGF